MYIQSSPEPLSVIVAELEHDNISQNNTMTPQTTAQDLKDPFLKQQFSLCSSLL